MRQDESQVNVVHAGIAVHVRVGVVADPHWVIVTRRSATSCQYTTSDSRRFRQRIATFGVLPSSRLRS